MAASKLCSIPNCGKRHYGRGMCSAHYQRYRRHGDPLGGGPSIPPRPSICTIPECSKPHYGHGWCQNHWHRWRKYGDPLAGPTFKGEPPRFFRETVLTYDGEDCLIWPYSCTAGYGTLGVDRNMRLVSRLVCEELYGPAPTPKHEAAHSCGKGHLGCVTPAHLSWKTPTENQADKLIHGTHNRGERQGRSKLTEADVREIRSLRKVVLQRDLAARFGVSYVTISDIQRRRSWSWLE